MLSIQSFKDRIKKNFWSILTWGLVVFFGILYISLIFNQNVWTDEVFTFNLLKNDIPGIIEGTAQDVHPPLYYLYAKIFECLWPQNVQAQKIATIIPMVTVLIYLSIKAKILFNEKAAFFSILFLTCLPCTMEFAVQIRMYSLALLFVTISALEAYELYINYNIKSCILLVIGSVGAAYTHYFAFVSICFINAILFVFLLFNNRKTLKRYFICLLVMLLLYSPWMPYMYKQVTAVRAGYWIAPITLETIWSYFVWTFGLNLLPGFEYLYIALIGSLIVLSFIYIKKDKKYIGVALLSLLIPILTAGSGVIISLSKAPIYRDQYILPALGTLALFVGISIAVILKNAENTKVVTVFMAVITIFLLLSGAVQYKECYLQEYKSTYLEKTMAWYNSEVGPNDYILYNYKPMGYVYEYYFPQDRLFYVEDFDLSSDYDNVWFLCSPECWPITQNDLVNYNLWMEHCGWYGIEHSEFDLFKVTHND